MSAHPASLGLSLPRWQDPLRGTSGSMVWLFMNQSIMYRHATSITTHEHDYDDDDDDDGDVVYGDLNAL